MRWFEYFFPESLYLKVVVDLAVAGAEYRPSCAQSESNKIGEVSARHDGGTRQDDRGCWGDKTSLRKIGNDRLRPQVLFRPVTVYSDSMNVKDMSDSCGPLLSYHF